MAGLALLVLGLAGIAVAAASAAELASEPAFWLGAGGALVGVIVTLYGLVERWKARGPR